MKGVSKINSLNKKYKIYLLKGNKPTNDYSNPYNLFDELNLIDGKWLNNARQYLAGLEFRTKK